MSTEKIYYSDMYLKTLTTQVIEIKPEKLVLAATIAYPEGGGQEPDHGEIITTTGETLRFNDVQKYLGKPIYLNDFPVICVDSLIEHFIHPEDLEKLSQLSIGDQVKVQIDINRRERLTISHTVSHLVYVGVGKVRPEAIDYTVGCHIKEESARFDFALSERILPEELLQIEKIANTYLTSPFPITLYAHPEHPDARFWECNNEIIPCGGTHLPSTGQIKSIQIKRKGMGKGKERINIEFDAELALDKYHL